MNAAAQNPKPLRTAFSATKPFQPTPVMIERATIAFEKIAASAEFAAWTAGFAKSDLIAERQAQADKAMNLLYFATMTHLTNGFLSATMAAGLDVELILGSQARAAIETMAQLVGAGLWRRRSDMTAAAEWLLGNGYGKVSQAARQGVRNHLAAVAAAKAAK
jgi:hypothetical protein